MAHNIKYEHLPLPPIPNTNLKKNSEANNKNDSQENFEFIINRNTSNRNMKQKKHSYNNAITMSNFDLDRVAYLRPSKVLKSDKETAAFLNFDNFWLTIAQGRQSQDRIDRLVRRYFATGGNPNVAILRTPINRLKVGYSLVHALILAGCTKSLEVALQAGANPNCVPITKPGDRISPLVLAARENNIDSIQLLVLYGARLFHSKGPLGESPLHAAVLSNSENIVHYLLQKSQNHLLKTADFIGATPLHYAAMKGRCRLVLLFIKKGLSDLNCQDNNGEIPLHYAIRHRRLNMVKLLTEMSTDTHLNVSDLLNLAKKSNAGAVAHYLRQIEIEVLNNKVVEIAKICPDSIKNGGKYECVCVYNIRKMIRKHIVTRAQRLIKKKLKL